jgi:hypothetical protein
MRSLIRYLASYLVDSFRERVAPDDFPPERIRRVWALDAEAATVARRFFPEAEVAVGDRGAGQHDAVVIPMRGGEIGLRLSALLGSARHRLLVPSPDYVYRFGMRRGALALAWAVVDRLLLLPLALLWLGAVTVGLYGSGLAQAGREKTGRDR